MTGTGSRTVVQQRTDPDAPWGYVSTTADGVILTANPTLVRWLGLDAEQVVRRRFTDFMNDGARVVWLTHHIPRLVDEGRLNAVSLELQRDDGVSLPVLVSAVLGAATDGDRPVVCFSLVDASERVMHERELLAARLAAESAQWRLHALQQITEACSTSLTEHQLLVSATRAVATGLEVACARVWLVDDGALAVATGFGDDHRDTHDSLPAEPLTALAAEALWASGACEVQRDPRTADPECALVAFGHAEQFLGVLEARLPRSWRGTESELQVLTTVAPVLGQAVSRVRLLARFERMALHDPLTGLPNRNLLFEAAEQAIARASRSGRQIAVLVVDLDGFKAINDTYGHLAGDQVLAEAGRRLQSSVRDGDLVARIGGDEFVVLCEDAGHDVADRLAHRIRHELSRPSVLRGRPTAEVRASVGVVVAQPPFGAASFSRLVSAADEAMYAEKHSAGKRR